MTNELSELFERDLLKLRDELNNFKNEENIWRKLNGITNTAGNLALHIIGNLNFLVGNLVGSTAYVRNREYEFSATGVPRKKLVDDIDELIAVLKNALSNLAGEEVQATYPLEFYGKRSTGFYLMHLYGHLNYHLGQINYLRRILEA